MFDENHIFSEEKIKESIKEIKKQGKEIVILGGGTFSHIASHFSLAAPSFGTTAKTIASILKKYKVHSSLTLTKMAEPTSNLVTNKDVSNYLDEILTNNNIGCIIMNVAMCDYRTAELEQEDETGEVKYTTEFGSHGERIKTSNGNISLLCTPAEKIISKIRKIRPDIFLIGFKTTTNATSQEQFETGLKFMKFSKCNLVLCNDTITENNFFITAEESKYCETINRQEALEGLVQCLIYRLPNTYTGTIFTELAKPKLGIDNLPENFKKVLQFLIDNKGFICNNGNGFTPGHFCYRFETNQFWSSQRKADHNKVFDEGMTLVNVEKDYIFAAYGTRKPSVGARSQWTVLKANLDYDCIVHTHNPLKEGSKIPVREQIFYQCGSSDCGLSTLKGLSEFEDGKIKAVYLNKHGANILFNHNTDPEIIIKFIKDNLQLGVKTI